MRNWYRVLLASVQLNKIASITFSLADSHKIAQPQGLNDLSWELRNFAWSKATDIFKENGSDPVTPDGASDYSGFTGTINFYFHPRYVKPERVLTVINKWIDDKKLLDFDIRVDAVPQNSGAYVGSPMEGYDPESKKFRGFTLEEMKDYDMPAPKDDDYTWDYNVRPEFKKLHSEYYDKRVPLKVFRIHVLQNGSKSLEQIPELNLANSNAASIIRALGLPFDYSGAVPLVTVQQRLQKLRSMSSEQLQQELSSHTREHIDTHNMNIPEDATPEERAEIIREQAQNRQHVRFIGFGLNIDDIMYRLSGIEQMVEYGLRNGFKEIQWG